MTKASMMKITVLDQQDFVTFKTHISDETDSIVSSWYKDFSSQGLFYWNDDDDLEVLPDEQEVPKRCKIKQQTTKTENQNNQTLFHFVR